MTHALAGWRKSSRSGDSTACVEIGFAPGVVGVRDTKDRQGGTIALSAAAWARFVDALKADRYGT
ncbi:DUF397 domain-containing protein [Saccharopolyspora erythraea]|uniref:DUF397 domain-containing protein n=1 Tax=Saccharopolyspora erythraea TaxID=1836 RepID=UPI001BA7BDDA|nr:DUF397 domain-containing protein [Saccharopolyspora erythraea]QUG99989.1 DUF397 domain-containing protein [Saccharopolyspora erythraea]